MGDPADSPRSLLPPLPQGSREGEPWDENELIVTLAACPSETQNYDQTRPWVIELADLLGRSPGAISRHFGNFFSLKTHGEGGLRNVGKLTVQVFEKYQGREDDLRRDARRIRDSLYEESTSPRVEAEVAEASASQLEEELRARFPEARLPPDTIILYRRSGSIWTGVMMIVQLAILYPDETKQLFRWVIELLGPKARRTPVVDLVLEGNQLALADREIFRRAPKFHTDHLGPKDRITLALRLPRLMSLRSWRPQASRIELFSRSSTDTEKKRLEAYFGIETSDLCNTCLMMLLDALEDGLARGRF